MITAIQLGLYLTGWLHLIFYLGYCIAQSFMEGMEPGDTILYRAAIFLFLSKLLSED